VSPTGPRRSHRVSIGPCEARRRSGGLLIAGAGVSELTGYRFIARDSWNEATLIFGGAAGIRKGIALRSWNSSQPIAGTGRRRSGLRKRRDGGSGTDSTLVAWGANGVEPTSGASEVARATALAATAAVTIPALSPAVGALAPVMPATAMVGISVPASAGAAMMGGLAP
jgi:hypothetical protein